MKTKVLFALSLVVAGCGVEARQDEAKHAAQKWAQDHVAGWTLTVDDADHAFTRPSFNEVCPNNTLMVRYAATGYEIDLAFTCPGPQGTDLAGLRSSFKFAVLTTLPHGLDVPSWKFDILTPSSSFKDGVEIVSWDSGRLKVKVDTRLFALDGRKDSEECRPPADGRTPAACLVRVELNNLPLRFTITAPLSPDTLKVQR
jgi:hypothetical protein